MAKKRPQIPANTQMLLWAKAAGRCEYEGCNKLVYRDLLTKTEIRAADIAHVIAASPDGPRGGPLSHSKQTDVRNLMLLCKKHHRLVDHEGETEHSIKELLRMKQQHERRIEQQTEAKEDKQSHVLLYGANIGDKASPINFIDARNAMSPKAYPAEVSPIEIHLKGSLLKDNEKTFWKIEKSNLERAFTERVAPRINTGDINGIRRMSLFAMAPQPLLVRLGTLLSDIVPVEVFQLHREPRTWAWQRGPKKFTYFVGEPHTRSKKVALNLSLSATIDNKRIETVIGRNASIWTISISHPGNDYLKAPEQLALFRKTMRDVFNRIKLKHGEKTLLHVFLAAPISVATELGRVWMPKADLPLALYDQSRRSGGFIKVFDIR